MQLGGHKEEKLADWRFIQQTRQADGKEQSDYGSRPLLLRIIYAVLRDKSPYRELGTDYLGTKEKTVEYWVRKIKQMGYDVELHELKTA